jgi:GT2 family glycosyltransferase
MINSEFVNVSLSIVSHGQGLLIRNLLSDLMLCRFRLKEIIITINIPEEENFLNEYYEALPIRVLRNDSPKGFGANHNSAFTASMSTFFIVANPDIRLINFALDKLLTEVSCKSIGVAAPAVYASDGQLQDSARRFPTLGGMLSRRFRTQKLHDYIINERQLDVDWVAGMFMVFRSEIFDLIGGFDEDYFMYLEDVDICRRLNRLGLRVSLFPEVFVVHDAQHASRYRLRYFLFHISSVCKYFIKEYFK